MSNKKVPTSVTLPEELVKKLDADARKEGRSRSNTVVKRLLDFYKLDANLAEEGGDSANKA